MSFKNDNEIDMNLFASILKDAVSRVKTEENPEVLNNLKKVYKQNVPFTLRTYVAAYLAKLAMQGNNAGKNSLRNRRDVHENRPSSTREWKNHDSHEKAAAVEDTATSRKEENKERVPHTPKVQIDEALATTIFIGIGRNRRVYPRDLVGLLVSVAGLDRDRIGDIRVLANYSFVQLFTEDADKAISALNGYDYRGRKLSVSYSRQKGEGEEGTDDSEKVTTDTSVPASAGPAVQNDDPVSAAEDAAAYAAAEKAAADKEPFSAPVTKTDTPLV